MKIGIMQPYVFPYIGYFQLIHATNRFVFYDDVNFITRGWINRNNLNVNNSSWMFTVPLVNASQNIRIKDTKIADNDWGKKLLKTINMAYKKAPFFSEIYEIVERILLNKHSSIGDLAKESVMEVCNYLNLEVDFVYSSEVYDNNQLKGSDRIMDICLKEGITNYINPIGGKDLYSHEEFSKKGLELNFIRPILNEYNSNGNLYISGLSIIDVLMHNGIEECSKLLKNYKLEK